MRPLHLLIAFLLFAGLGTPTAALAHKEHREENVAATAVPSPSIGVVLHPMSEAVHEGTREELAALEAEAARSWHERLLDWLGRVHPFAVHFPLALFPVAWIALILARRRGDAPDLIRSLIVVAGASASLAAVLGWLDGGFLLADRDPILRFHRWTGTALGLAGLAVASWAWRSPSAVESRAMTSTLGAITLALLVQGWLGGALIHGVDHLNW